MKQKNKKAPIFRLVAVHTSFICLLHTGVLNFLTFVAALILIVNKLGGQLFAMAMDEIS